MLFAQINIDELKQTIWLIVLEAANLQRMQVADPINLEADSRGGLIHTPKYPDNMSVLVAYEWDTGPIDQLSLSGDLYSFLDHLERGRRRLSNGGFGYVLKAHGVQT
ncbi:MAG TPA: hypothetical protein VGP83_17200 [Pyrinomonadaceae bacterium]|nr:hypothetical protein [Pyrinomonadaceae bacterium]